MKLSSYTVVLLVLAETYKKPRIFAPRRFYADATMGLPPARDWCRADLPRSLQAPDNILSTLLDNFCFFPDERLI